VCILDSAAFYAHNELEIAAWQGHHNKISDEVYTRTYMMYCEPSEPKNEWEDRQRLYYSYWNVIYSVNHLEHGKAIRQV
jgi:protein-ribulosamine 3-kinase